MKYGLIGKKLSHSFSKEIHEQLFCYEYNLLEIAEEELDAFLEKREFRAINVTIPYKEAVIPYLDEIDEAAREIGAVNTIINRDGRLFGYNTDFLGMKLMLKKAEIELENKKVLILGSGGTSKTAAAVAGNCGCSASFRVSRSGNDGCITYEDAYKNHSDADIIINTTPCGMFPNLYESAIDIDKFPRLSGVADAVYNPLRSKLIVDALSKNITATGGLYMLIAQAAFAAELFTGKDVPAEKIDKIYRDMLKRKENIVLIGMPGCGKSTIGRALAKELSMDFADSDDEIIKLAGCSIPEIFDSKGEEYFRTLEAQVIRTLSAKQNTVIATGGGAILRRENAELLSENGRIYFIDRPIEYLVASLDRPLSSSREALQKRYNERYSIYCSLCDRHIKASQNLQKNIDTIKKDFLL